MKTIVPTAIVAAVAVAAAAALAGQRPFGGERGRPPRAVAALDADGDGVIAAAEIRNAPQALRALDTDGDGRIGAGEWGAGGRPGGPGGPGGEGGPPASAAELTDTLMTFDRDGNGRLAKAEVPERFQGLFARADADADGVLTREELQRSATASVEEGAARRGGGPDPLLRALDTDRDGAISSAELSAAPASLATLDTNQDGVLAGDEFRPRFRGAGRREGGPR